MIVEFGEFNLVSMSSRVLQAIATRPFPTFRRAETEALQKPSPDLRTHRPQRQLTVTRVRSEEDRTIELGVVEVGVG